MNLKVGEKIVFTNIKKLKPEIKCKVQEGFEYVVLALDQSDGCPYIVVDDALLYLSNSELKYVVAAETGRLTYKEYKQLLLKFPYIPKSKATLHLINQLEEQNNKRAFKLAINIALEENNHELLDKLLKLREERE